MTNIVITIGNEYLPNLIESFYHPSLDIGDLEEIEYCIDECCGLYLDLYADAIHGMCPDCSDEEIAEACFYTVEEVNPNEL